MIIDLEKYRKKKEKTNKELLVDDFDELSNIINIIIKASEEGKRITIIIEDESE